VIAEAAVVDVGTLMYTRPEEHAVRSPTSANPRHRPEFTIPLSSTCGAR
jgi:hypothetical protein